MCALIPFFFLSFHSDSISVNHSLNPNVFRADYSLVIQRTTDVLFEPALRNWQHWSGRSCEQNAWVFFVANPSQMAQIIEEWGELFSSVCACLFYYC